MWLSCKLYKTSPNLQPTIFLFLLHLNNNSYHIHLHLCWPRTMQHLCPLLLMLRNRKLSTPFHFLEKGMTQSHSSMTAVYISTAGNQSSQWKTLRFIGSYCICVMIRLFLFFHLFTSCALSHDPQSVSLSIAAQCLMVTTCCCTTPHL